jgi:hypothetical protein
MEETDTTLSAAEPDYNSPQDKLHTSGKTVRRLYLTLFMGTALGMGVMGILLLTTEVIVLQTPSNNLSGATSVNTTTPSHSDIFRSIIGSFSGLDASDAHSTHQHKAWSISNVDVAQIQPGKTIEQIRTVHRSSSSLCHGLAPLEDQLPVPLPDVGERIERICSSGFLFRKY